MVLAPAPPSQAVEINGKQYLVQRGVPLFDAHTERRAPAPYDNVTPELLQEIVDANNARVADTGDVPLLVIRHTRENYDPPVVGFARDFRVVHRFGKLNPRPAIVADFYVEAQHQDLANAHPRRSVELWPDTKIIDPISLLGAESPKRDLGLLQFGKGCEVYRYRRQGNPLRFQLEDSFMDPTELANALAQTPFFQSMAGMMEKLTQQMDAEAAPAPEPAPEEPEQFGEPEPAPEEPINDDPLKNQEATPPGGSNTTVPDDEDEAEMYRKKFQKANSEALKFQRDNESLGKRLAKIERERDEEKYNRELDQLASQGYLFDRAHLLDLGLRYGRKSFDQGKEQVLQYSRRDIEAVEFPETQNISIGGKQSGPMKYSKEEHKKLMEKIKHENSSLSWSDASQQAHDELSYPNQ